MKIAVVSAPGIGDTLILHIASHNLRKWGHDVTTFTDHNFGKWLPGYKFAPRILPSQFDAVFLQHCNDPLSFEADATYNFYGVHNPSKHSPLKTTDFVCDRRKTMVDNVVTALHDQFLIPATADNGLTPPKGLIHRCHKKRVVIHSTNAKDPWPEEKFHEVADWLKSQGYEPFFLPVFPTLEELASCIYESGFFIGNDSGPGHLASALKIPNLIIGKDPENMRLWRPGWLKGELALPLLNWRPVRKYWKELITTKSVISKLKTKILNN